MPLPPSSVSIVIPNYNGKELLKKHLPAVLTAAPDAEIIVVDDASTDESVRFLTEQYPGVKIVLHHINRRFAVACNSGVAAATREIIVLLNSDVSPHADFLPPLIAPFDDDTVFAVGCKEVQKKRGKVKESGRSGSAFSRGLVTHWRTEEQSGGPTAWVAGGSGAFRKSMWETLGGMDVLFRPAYEEDRDLSYRALKRGWKVLFEPGSVVNHNHETTNVAALGRVRMGVASYKNHVLFVWKNITSWRLFGLHLLWLPYHLVVTSYKSRGQFLLGFLWALIQLPEVLPRRAREIREAKNSDGKILAGLAL